MAEPVSPLVRSVHGAWFRHVVPFVGGIVSDRAAYRYLPQSLVNFPDADALAALFEANGFAAVRCVPLMGGVATLHIGTKAKAPVAPRSHTPEAVAP